MKKHTFRLFKRQTPLAQATKQAARALSGTLTHTEAKSLSQWPQRGPEYGAEFIGTLRMMAELEPLANDPEINSLLDQASRKYPKKNWAKWPVLAAAASLLVAVMVGLWFQSVPEESTILKYATRIGEQKTFTLVDGSVITLNTGTQILVDFSKDSRRVILERGEGYFDIAADPQRPFSVNLGEYAITVLGTQFNLLKSPEKFTLAVVEGQVAVHGSDSSPDALAPSQYHTSARTIRLGISGQKILAGTVAEYDYLRGELSTYQPAHIEKVYSWRSGLLSFEKARLGEVVEELNRYTRKKILIRDSELMDMHVYATIRLDQVAQALEGLEISLPIKVISFYDRYIIVAEKEHQ